MAYIPSGRFNAVNGNEKTRTLLKCQTVLDVVNEHFDTSTDVLISKSRRREIVWPRQVSMYFLAYYTSMTLKGIGVIFGNKDHTTVVHAVQTVNDLQQSDPLVKDQIREMTLKLDTYVRNKENAIGGSDIQYPGNA